MTYHSCAMEFLRFYGRFVGLPPRVSVMDTLEQKLLALEESWSHSPQEHEFKLFELAKTRGLLAFETLIPLAVKLLSSSNRLRQILTRRYPVIIVDEFQDTSQDQWQLLRLLGENSQVVAFGDPNQIIYASRHAATAKRFSEFTEWKGIKPSKFSARNFRCENASILDFADSLLTGTPCQKPGQGVNIINIGYRNKLRLALTLIWKDIVTKIGPNQTIGFFVPSSNIATEVALALRNPPSTAKAPFTLYTRVARDEAAFDSIMLAIAAISDFVIVKDKRSCHKAAIALVAMDLAWNTKKKIARIDLVADLLRNWLDKPTPKLVQLLNKNNTINLDVLKEPFIEMLNHFKGFEVTCKKISAHGRMSVKCNISGDQQLLLFDELRANRKPKGLEGYDAGEGQTHVINYHKTKGREFDFVAMVIDPRGESTRADLEEQRRLYYVCATRAKYTLFVLHYGNEFGRVLGPVLRPV